MFDEFQIKKYIDSYLISKLDKSISTRQTYSKTLNEFLFFCKVQKSCDFSLSFFQNYLQYLKEAKKMEQNSLKTYLSGLSGFLKYLIQNGIINSNNLKQIKITRKHSFNILSFITVSQLNILLDSIGKKNIQDARDRAIIAIIATTGLDENRILELKFNDFKMFRKKYILAIPDDSSNQISVPIADFVHDILLDYNLMRTKIKNCSDDNLFVSFSNRTLNKKLTERGIQEMIKIRFMNSELSHNEKISKTSLTLKNTGAIYLAGVCKKIEDLMAITGYKHRQTAERFYNFSAKIRK